MLIDYEEKDLKMTGKYLKHSERLSKWREIKTRAENFEDMSWIFVGNVWTRECKYFLEFIWL